MTDAPAPFGDGLAALDLDAVAPFYAEPPEAARDVEIGLDADRVHARTPTKRSTWNALHVANLAKALGALPAPGETLHVVCRGNWPAWALVPRALELAAPATIRWLGLATLGFSRENIDELAGMLDAGLVGRADLLFSCYFRSHEVELVGHLAAEMATRGQRTVALRTHAKVIAAELTDGTALVVESSANLRSCRNVEQFTISNDRPLLDFHRGWMDELIRAGDKK